MKPRLRLTMSFGPGSGWWECTDGTRTCVDATPVKAYLYWLRGTPVGRFDAGSDPKPARWWEFWK